MDEFDMNGVKTQNDTASVEETLDRSINEIKNERTAGQAENNREKLDIGGEPEGTPDSSKEETNEEQQNEADGQPETDSSTRQAGEDEGQPDMGEEEQTDMGEAVREYFGKQEEKINKTKAKLQDLLAKLQENPEKDTISKKILRLRIDRLRTKLNRSMAKFDIEYNAELGENEDYDKFYKECDSIKERKKELQGKEDELEKQLEKATRKENYRRETSLDKDIRKMAPKSRKGKETQLKSTPRKSKTSDIKKELAEVREEISALDAELKEKKESYKQYKSELKKSTREAVNEKMQDLKDQEAQLRRQNKEQLAIEKPSLWSKIKNKVRNTVNKISAWNEKRKQEKATIAKKKDEMVSEATQGVLNKRTAFRDSLNAEDYQLVAKELEGANNPEEIARIKEEAEEKGISSEIFAEALAAHLAKENAKKAQGEHAATLEGKTQPGKDGK